MPYYNPNKMEDSCCHICAPSPEDLPPAATLLLESFPEERVFAFFAPMGAGKTTFIQALCKCLHVRDNVVSPTFSLINEYSCGDRSVFHFDFYRLKNFREAIDIGTEEYLESGDYCFLEWSEVIEPILPLRYVKVTIDVDEATSCRTIRARLIDHEPQSAR